jgi:hypothetical protein
VWILDAGERFSELPVRGVNERDAHVSRRLTTGKKKQVGKTRPGRSESIGKAERVEPLIDFAKGRNLEDAASAYRLRFK